MAQVVVPPAWRWWWSELDVALDVSLAAADVLAHHRQGARDKERGGQLFADPHGIGAPLLAVATPPDVRDRAGPTWLELDSARCETEAAYWQARGLLRIGVWHTHAEMHPQLSGQDRRSLGAYARANRFFPVAVIVGQATGDDGIRAWSIRAQETPQALREPLLYAGGRCGDGRDHGGHRGSGPPLGDGGGEGPPGLS